MEAKSKPRVSVLYCAPGNGGIGRMATCVGIEATDIKVWYSSQRIMLSIW